MPSLYIQLRSHTKAIKWHAEYSFYYSATVYFSFKPASHKIGVYQSLPEEANLITSDIANFYKAFDLALQDTAHAKDIFEEFYFKVGSKGLKDFFKYKIQSHSKFSKFVITHQAFYQSIRHNISDIQDLKDQIISNFREFKSIYPEAVFPNIYFLIGRFSSNGTISKNGLLIGTEILGRTADTNTKEWNKSIRKVSMLRSHIPVTVSHELVHFNQGKMKKGKTLLARSMREGSAEFIAELISGETDGNYDEFVGREAGIWQDFKQEMNENIWYSWHRANEKRPRNAAYWTGYMICKAYYNQVGDKAKAVDDILHIRDYEEFYRLSKVEGIITN